MFRFCIYIAMLGGVIWSIVGADRAFEAGRAFKLAGLLRLLVGLNTAVESHEG